MLRPSLRRGVAPELFRRFGGLGGRLLLTVLLVRGHLLHLRAHRLEQPPHSLLGLLERLLVRVALSRSGQSSEAKGEQEGECSESHACLIAEKPQERLSSSRRMCASSAFSAATSASRRVMR